MSETANITARRAAERANAGRFDPISMALHWLTVVLVAAQFGTALLFGQSHEATFLTVHRSTGVAIFAVMVVRLAWRRSFAYLPPFPDRMPKVQQYAATLNEYGLYGLLLLQALTGSGDTLFRGRPVMLFIWQMPALLPRNTEAQQLLHVIHEWGAKAILVLIGIHVGAALFHGLILRDGIFSRMLPTVRGRHLR